MRQTFKRAVAVSAMVLIASSGWAQVCERPTTLPVEQWNLMGADSQLAACRPYLAAMQAQEAKQPVLTEKEEKARAQRRKWNAQAPSAIKSGRRVKTGERVSPTLGWIGMGTILGGLLVMTPMGEEYHILGDTYCVSTDYHSVWEGGCGPDADAVKFGAAMMGVGAVLALIGFQSKTVTVGASVGHDVIGAKATIRWGGTR
jgi:hypothetical protein